ncbi:MAG: PhnD/SsuA/transferrin family substrate-binding protein, partial [Betaproteobacteria bacterium]
MEWGSREWGGYHLSRKEMLLGLAMALALLTLESAAAEIRSFGVLNQRSAVLTARYWNPILQYVSHKTGVPLELKMGRTAPETSAMIGRSELDFVYSNTIFTPLNAPAACKVLARPAGP